jgi:hypothetical protein
MHDLGLWDVKLLMLDDDGLLQCIIVSTSKFTTILFSRYFE